MSISSRRKISPDWISKTVAGAFLGLLLAFGLVGIFAWVGPDGIAAANKSQFVMWMVPPCWLTVFSLTYLFHSGRQAWFWLGGLSITSVLAMLSLRYFMVGI